MSQVTISAQVPKSTYPITGETKRRLMIRLLVGALLAPVILCASLARAQLVGPQPGLNDPVGAPASYMTLRSDDLMVGQLEVFATDLMTYQVNDQSDVTNLIPADDAQTVTDGAGNSVSASGHFTTQDGEQVVNVARAVFAASRNTVVVGVAPGHQAGGGAALLHLHNLINNVPDQIAVAAGDLDKVPDENGVNHDEVAVAYVSDSGQLQLAVLNYSSVGNFGEPRFVTQTVAPNQLISINSPLTSEVLSVAIGDFDGDGQNEIALATLHGSDPGEHNLPTEFELSIFPYHHVHLTDRPSLQLVTDTVLHPAVSPVLPNNLPTISLAAGDFLGTGKQELAVALLAAADSFEDSIDPIQPVVQTIAIDSNLQPTVQGGSYAGVPYSASYSDLIPARVIVMPGLFNYDPANGFDLYRRELALLASSPVRDQPDLEVQRVQIANNLTSVTPLPGRLSMPNTGVGAKWDATAGGLAVEANIQTPLWSLAIEQIKNADSPAMVTTLADVAGSLQPASRATVPGCSDCATDPSIRPTIQAYDYRGRSVFLGAPIRLTINNLINTDFVLQEPPKHAYWDEAAGQLVTVSRFPTIAASLTNTQGTSFAGKSTDNSNFSLGGSVALSASFSAEGGFGDLAKVSASTDVSTKVSYNYDHNQSDYNSNYASRTLSETESTDNDDFISGRAQIFDIWRYRVLGVSASDSSGKPLSAFYDAVFPGPTLDFKASGLDLDWYQPLYENHILSYPAPSSSTFNPPDIGTYGIPCPSGHTDCTNGIEMVAGAMIPATAEFISDTSGTIGLDYSNTTGSGDSVTYQHKITTSSDVKQSYSAKVSLEGVSAGASASVDVNFSSNNSWGNTSTSDSTTTSTTGIKISRAAISSVEAYEFFPTVYTTLDGTVKVAQAVDPLASASGRAFWSTLYGAKPDPALNLPLRFVRNNSAWTPNTLISRKQMRGCFVLGDKPNPVTGEYDPLAQAPADGDQVRLSAQVYNYSTAKSFNNCLVQFYAIKYDSGSNTESGRRIPIGATTISLPPRGNAPAQVVGSTRGFGPADGGQDYRIYVDLNSDKSIDEIYPPEDPSKSYASGLPVGLDPGQNDEGWGLVTVMARSAAEQSSGSLQSVRYSFGATPLAIVSSGRLSTENLEALPGRPVLLRSQVCASSNNSRDPVDLVVFDGPPANGNVISWKRIYVPNRNKCEGTWFSWTPTRGQHNLVATILPNGVPAISPRNVRTLEAQGLTKARLHVSVP